MWIRGKVSGTPTVITFGLLPGTVTEPGSRSVVSGRDNYDEPKIPEGSTAFNKKKFLMNGKIRSCTYGNVNDPDMELRVDITDPLNSIYDIFDRSVSILIQYFPNNKIAEGSNSGISSGREKSASRKNSGYMVPCPLLSMRGEK